MNKVGLLVIIDEPELTEADLHKMSPGDLNTLRLRHEDLNRSCKQWLADVNRRVAAGEPVADKLQADLTEAVTRHTRLIRRIHTVFSERKYRNVPASNGTLRLLMEEAEKRRLEEASETATKVAQGLADQLREANEALETLRRKCASAEHHAAFYETARIVLAESTFRRIENKAMELQRQKRFSNGGG